MIFILMMSFGYSFSDELFQQISVALTEPVTVYRSNGSSFVGHFARLKDSGVTLACEVGLQGSVEVDFNWDEIEQIDFPCSDRMGEIQDFFLVGNHLVVIECMKPIYDRQSVFFPAMDIRDMRLFQMLARSYFENGQSSEAIAVVRAMKTWMNSPTEIGDLTDIELLAFLDLQMMDDAKALAVEKIQQSSFPSDTEAAWLALSICHLEKENFREAWLAATHGLLFGSCEDTMRRSDAYMVVMIATIKLNRPKIALRFFNEWKATGLSMESKPYQRHWFEWWSQIDWALLAENAGEVEAFADIEAQLETDTSIDLEEVPIMNIPIQTKETSP